MGGITQPKRVLLRGVSGETVNTYDDVSAVPALTLTTIVTYSVPAGESFLLQTVEFSGENMARFDVTVENVLIGRKRTYFGGQVFGEFFFGNLQYNSEQTIALKVFHDRPESGDFEGRIVGVLEE